MAAKYVFARVSTCMTRGSCGSGSSGGGSPAKAVATDPPCQQNLGARGHVHASPIKPTQPYAAMLQKPFEKRTPGWRLGGAILFNTCVEVRDRGNGVRRYGNTDSCCCLKVLLAGRGPYHELRLQGRPLSGSRGRRRVVVALAQGQVTGRQSRWSPERHKSTASQGRAPNSCGCWRR